MVGLFSGGVCPSSMDGHGMAISSIRVAVLVVAT
jgi:hypothetical protein